MPRLLFLPICVFAAALLIGGPTIHLEQNYSVWTDNGGGPDNSHFSALNQITKENVGQLQVAWSYPSNDTISYVWNPLIVGNVMYVLARNDSLVALDATTGKEIWIHEALTGIAPRGINYWESKDHKDRRLIFQKNSYLEEINADTGKSILTFGTGGIVNLREGLRRYSTSGPLGRVQSNNPGKIFENLLLQGTSPGEGFLAPPGDLRAYDVTTGALVWQFHTIPHPGEFGYDTWTKDAWLYAGGANTWGEISVDAKRGIAYFPTGSATYDFYGADRPGANLFGDCLIALDARTGKRLWHFQAVHHDLWDYDNTSAPQLITVVHKGKKVDAVAMAGKTGFLYVFNRLTGEPLWPIKETPVPSSDMPGEHAWPTQPIPTAPPPFSVQKFTADDVNPYVLTAEERAHWRQVVDSALNKGLFTPPSTRDTINMPGNQGGSNWGTTAANPAAGIVYVMGLNEPAILKLSKDMPHSNRFIGGSAAQGRTIYERNCQGCHGVDLRGNGNYPSLIDIMTRIGVDTVRSTVNGGKGPMPSFSADLKETDMNNLLTFLSNPAAAGSGHGRQAAQEEAEKLGGPVVASGGAPAGQVMAKLGAGVRGNSPYGSMGGPPYPEGVDAPSDRYYTGYNIMGNIIKPPYSTLTAYDLNKGTIKWQVPVGDDLRALKEGAHDTGAIGIRVGMVTTSTGLVFMAGGDMKIRAYDQETGKVLWTAKLPGQSKGIPAIYEAGGKEYLIVNATSPPGGRESPIKTDSDQPRGYIAFTLP
ncbi:MAG TPA: PQQ-binding-like beta-propeller repeat protein [Bryobacteraceae bacterium]|jgi:quinoprotein glucose dehydrogenase